MSSALYAVTLDSVNAAKLASFWAEAAAAEVVGGDGGVGVGAAGGVGFCPALRWR